MALAFLHRGYASPIQMCSPITASSLQSCLLCCQPEPVPGRSPARSLLPAQYMSCRVLDCMGHILHMGLRGVQRSSNRSDLQTLSHRIQWFGRILAVGRREQVAAAEEKGRGGARCANKRNVCASCGRLPLDVPLRAAFSCWIPFGDHPLKLERYRED